MIDDTASSPSHPHTTVDFIKTVAYQWHCKLLYHHLFKHNNIIFEMATCQMDEHEYWWRGAYVKESQRGVPAVHPPIFKNVFALHLVFVGSYISTLFACRWPSWLITAATHGNLKWTAPLTTHGQQVKIKNNEHLINSCSAHYKILTWIINLISW